jgi:hypothetical protein
MFRNGYVGVAPGTTMMQLGTVPGYYGPYGDAAPCPPDPFWALVQTPLRLPWGPQEPGLPSSVAPKSGVMVPYGNETAMSGCNLFSGCGPQPIDGLRQSMMLGDAAPGPFGMSWLSFLGVMTLAIAGGVGLGYLSLRK